MSDALKLTNNRNDTKITTVTDIGMISLRGDFKSKKFRKTVLEICGVEIPAPREFEVLTGEGCIWMSPDELLLLVKLENTVKNISFIAAAFADEPSLVLNSSDARVIHQIKGPSVRDVLAKLTPTNMSQNSFDPSQVRRTRIGQVAAAICMLDDETIQVISFRSTSSYVFDLLSHSARIGSEVGFLETR